jgi:erythronate-4-phosphate dehydrogenase
LHVPLILDGPDRTFHLADQSVLASLRSGAFVLNSSRGEVVDSNALKQALCSGKLRGAVLDVWENEPEIDVALLDLATLGTPHIAGYSADGKAGGTAMSVQALSRYFGLGLDQWYPLGLPLPSPSVLKVDCRDKTREEVLMEAIRATYEIEKDDQKLRASVNSFEEQRGNYPVRREFLAYQVHTAHASEAVKNSLKDLGFPSVL